MVSNQIIFNVKHVSGFMPLHQYMLNTRIESKNILRTERKKIEEILEMSHKELLNYLRESDDTLQPTDLVQITPFEHGIRAFYFHKDSSKPFKTRVFLKSIDNSNKF